MRSQLTRWYPVALAVVAAAVSLAVLPQLPEPMAVHWDLQGNPNGWMPRATAAFLTPVMLLAVWGLLRAVPGLDPRRENYDKFSSAYDTVVAAVLALLFVGHLMVLAIALGYHVPAARIVPVLLGVMFLVVGNVMPRARSNFTFGIRTPWTLSSERVWASTHRLAGYAMAAGGLAMIAAGLFLRADLSVLVVAGAIAAALLGPAVCSYFIWRRETQK